MRKRVLFSLVMVLALVLSTSCSLIVKDEAVDLATPIIEVVGKTYTKADVRNQAQGILEYYEYMYSMYGMSYDITDANNIADAREIAIESLIQSAVIEDQMAKNGCDVLTEEEEAEVRASVEEDYGSLLDFLQIMFFSESEMDEEELQAALEAKAVELGYGSLEDNLDTSRSSKKQEKLKALVVADVTVSDEEIQTEYESLVAADMASYGEDGTSDWGSAKSKDTVLYYTPAGYRMVKQILVKYLADDQTAIDDANSALTSKKSELTTAQNSLSALGEAAEDEDEELAAQRAELTAQVEALTAEVAECEKQVEAATTAANANLQPTVDEIYAKISEGESFESLIEAYNEDPGMTAESEGYPVSARSTNYVDSFRDGSMALVNIGDVSEPVYSSYGVHIIKYSSDVQEGAVALEEVSEAIAADLLSEKQDQTYSDAISAWVAAADAKVYEDKLD